MQFVETKCNFGSLRVAFTFSLQLSKKASVLSFTKKLAKDIIGLILVRLQILEWTLCETVGIAVPEREVKGGCRQPVGRQKKHKTGGEMKKRENRVVKSLIAGVLCLSQLQIPVNVLAAEGEPENLALNKTTSASALEVSDG